MPAPARHSSAGRVATLTMRPPAPVRVMAMTAARQQRNAVTKFISSCFIKSDFVVLATGAMAKPPTRWIEAHSSGTASNSRATAASSARSAPATSLTWAWLRNGKRSASARDHIGHVADGAGLDQRAHHRGTERAGAAGDDDMAVAIVHRCLLAPPCSHIIADGPIGARRNPAIVSPVIGIRARGA